MNKLNFFLFLFLFTGCQSNTAKQPVKFEEALNCAEKWFKAWEVLSKDVFQLPENLPTRFVFFDTTFVYTTSPLTGKGGNIIEGPQLSSEKQIWYKKIHNGIVVLPDSATKSIQMMIFASPTKEIDVKGYFVMPLLSFWEHEKIDGHGIGLENLTAGVFTHEFCHTQQLGSFDKFGEYFEAYQKKNGSENFGDDMIQDFYENDKLISFHYKNELDAFKKAADANEKTIKAETVNALKLLEIKHAEILQKDKKDLKIIDDIWLTMEGVGQYAMYAWFINSKGGNLSQDISMKAIKTKSWSQEEGFAMFYLLSKYEKPETWAKYFFGSDMKTITEILRRKTK
jgi:hypothetical protein